MLVDLNCDLGESFGYYGLGEDEAMLRVVFAANSNFRTSEIPDEMGVSARFQNVVQRALQNVNINGLG